MSIEIILWIVVTTIYGFMTYKMGEAQGVRAFADVLVKAKVVESREDLYKKLLAFSESLDEEE
jgi:hypothetical protein